jgi:hypothetical protein
MCYRADVGQEAYKMEALSVAAPFSLSILRVPFVSVDVQL